MPPTFRDRLFLATSLMSRSPIHYSLNHLVSLKYKVESENKTKIKINITAWKKSKLFEAFLSQSQDT